MKATLFTAVVVAVSWCVRVEASPQMQDLLQAIRSTGTTIATNDPRFCKDPAVLGYYRYQQGVIDQLTLCVVNHDGDTAELHDTLLHEAIHVAQSCNGGPLFTTHTIKAASTEAEQKLVAKTYAGAQFDNELEARVVARDWDEVYVTNLIKEYCN